MEFLPGGSLDGYIQENLTSGIPETIQFKIIYGMSCGLASLAEQNIVHRDLAARNVLLEAAIEPKIADFGFSRVVGDADKVGQTNASVGPIKWMAPVRPLFPLHPM